MEGVTILNTYMAWIRSSTAILLFVNLLLAAGIVGGIVLIVDNDENIGVIVGVMCIFGILLMFRCVPMTEHIQATLDDSVSYVELTDRYEIVKSDGRIITMVEKEQKDDTE